MIPVYEPMLLGKIKEKVLDCIETGWISSSGKYIAEFEALFSRYIGTKHGIACSNATNGLFAALKAINISYGDEIIIPDHSIIVTSNVIIQAGGKPVPVDVDSKTYCIDPSKIEEKITRKTKGIMVVHIYGHPCDMDPIIKIAEKHNLFIIEDCAEAHGAEYKGKKVGSFGIASVFSFYANKVITTGEGGMVCTNNDKLNEKIRLLINQGYTQPRGKHWVLGYNFRLTNIQAAIGVAQMEFIDKIIEMKRNLAKKYNSLLKDAAGLELPHEAPWAKSVYWMYGVVLKDSVKKSREQICKELKELGIDTRLFFFPIRTQPVYAEGKNSLYPDSKGKFPVSDRLGEKGFYLPSSPNLKDEQIKTVVNALKKALSE